MRKILLFSFFLVLGLVGSQIFPNVIDSPTYISMKEVMNTMLYICLAFIMINVGREFEVDKTRWRGYVKDYGIAMATAEVPWLLVAFYFMFVLLPEGSAASYDSWRETLFLSRFTAPTSAGILFTMLACLGLSASWIYKKTQTLAIFDDLDTILLMIPLQIMMVGLRWEILVILGVVPILLIFGWKKLASFNIRQEWWAILLYSMGLMLLLWGIHRLFHVHIEVLLPAFVLGMVMRHKHHHGRTEERASTGISYLFMLLVGLSMPCFLGDGGPAISEAMKTDYALAHSVLGDQPMMPWPTIIMHVIVVSLLSNVGKMVPIFFYRDRKIEERLALSVGMFTRGEVGAGIIFIGLGYGIGGPALIIAVLTLVLNLILTGGFVVLVKKLSLRAYGKEEAKAALKPDCEV